MTQEITIKVKRLSHSQDIKLPTYATSGCSGVDLPAAILTSINLEPKDYVLIPTGLSILVPKGFEAQVRPRSGLALKHGITVLNSPGTIDSDYRGEIKVILINFGKLPFTIDRGMRIAQLVVNQINYVSWQEVNDLSDSGRGKSGFGSTGFI